MKKYLPTIIIVLLIAMPFALLVYYYGGFQKKPQQTVKCPDYSFEYFGIVKANQQITISLEDNYFYYSYGIISQPNFKLPLVN